MIKLSQTPVEGSAIKLNVSFKDVNGNFYVPINVKVTFLALNSDKETWSVIDNYYRKEFTPSSSLVITLEHLYLMSGTQPQRKVMIEWTAYVDGQITDFVDEASFEIKPRPIIVNTPPEPTPSPIYLKFTDFELQVGTMISVPSDPVFFAYSNLPIGNLDSEESSITLVEEGSTELIPLDILLDSVKTKLTISPTHRLENNHKYIIKIEGLVSTNGISMSESFETSFVVKENQMEEIQSELEDLDRRVTLLEEKPEPTPTVTNKLYAWVSSGGVYFYTLIENPEVGTRIKTLTDNHFLSLPVKFVTEEGLKDSETSTNVIVRDPSSDLDFTINDDNF